VAVVIALAAVVREQQKNSLDAGAIAVISLWPLQWRVHLADNGCGDFKAEACM